MSEPFLLPGDVFFTRGRGPLSRMIRTAERQTGEEPSVVNHTGMVVTPGTVYTAEVVEALWRVERHTLGDQYAGTGDQVAVFRLPVSGVARDLAARRARMFEGRRYGAWKLAAHLGDWALDRALGWAGWRDPFVFRRLLRLERYPICHWVTVDAVSAAYAVDELAFPLDERRADPDEVWDLAVQDWDLVRQLGPVGPSGAEGAAAGPGGGGGRILPA